jgi:hypothetical protein
MSQQAGGNGHTGELGRLVIVRVEDTVEPRLTEHNGGRYQSPPQTREQAMALVQLLLGRAPDANGTQKWSAAIAGGRRLVTVTEETRR